MFKKLKTKKKKKIKTQFQPQKNIKKIKINNIKIKTLKK